MNKKKIIKTFVSIIIAFICVSTFTNVVFIANSPEIRPELDKYIVYKLNMLIINNFGRRTTPTTGLTQNGIDTSLFKIGKGIYAKEENTTSIKEYRIREADWLEYKFQVKGKEIIIKVPKGDSVPSQAEVEAINK